MATDLSSLLADGVILPLSEATSRKQAIHRLCEALSGIVNIPTRQIEEAVMEREHLGSTGVGEGVAIPHARLEGIERPIGGFMRLTEGVDFEAVDDRPCDLIFMLLAPMNAGADHLRALAQVSRVLRQESVRDALRASKSEEAVRALICPESVETSDS